MRLDGESRLGLNNGGIYPALAGFTARISMPGESHQIVSQILQTQLDFGIGESHRPEELTAHAHDSDPKDMFDYPNT
jgi:hypothetical protein